MRTPGSPTELEARRRLAVQRVLDGYTAEEVADFLGVTARAVRGWAAAFRAAGPGGLAARPVPGRPAKLTPRQQAEVLRWLSRSPTAFGYANELWTARRVGEQIARRWGVRFNPRSLARWLRGRGLTPQRPGRVPLERDPAAIDHWRRADWRRIKKKPVGWAPIW